MCAFILFIHVVPGIPTAPLAAVKPGQPTPPPPPPTPTMTATDVMMQGTRSEHRVRTLAILTRTFTLECFFPFSLILVFSFL